MEAHSCMRTIVASGRLWLRPARPLQSKAARVGRVDRRWDRFVIGAERKDPEVGVEWMSPTWAVSESTGWPRSRR
jgi:hypothetical protein